MLDDHACRAGSDFSYPRVGKLPTPDRTYRRCPRPGSTNNLASGSGEGGVARPRLRRKSHPQAPRKVPFLPRLRVERCISGPHGYALATPPCGRTLARENLREPRVFLRRSQCALTRRKSRRPCAARRVMTTFAQLDQTARPSGPRLMAGRDSCLLPRGRRRADSWRWTTADAQRVAWTPTLVMAGRLAFGRLDGRCVDCRRGRAAALFRPASRCHH